MSAPSQPFVHLHCHTDYSLLDGCARVNRYMQRCEELNMPALAMTDHGNLFGAMAFYKACKKAGIKPLIGCEIYLVHDHRQDERPKRDRQRSDDIADVPEDALGPEHFPKHQIHHKTLIAKNFKGYQNLVKLVSDAHVNGMYYRPRTDMERLAQHSEGVIGLSGCINGVASQHLIYNNHEKAREVMGQFIDIFGKENYFVEIQDHGMPVQRRIIPGLLKLAKEFDLPVVAANDVHYVYKNDSAPHDALLCIQTGKLVTDDNRMRYPCQEFYLKSHAEMSEIFREVPESVANTLKVAEMVELEIPFGENHYPHFERPVEIEVKNDPQNFDAILDVYVREKNKVLERDGEDSISLSEEERTQHKLNGLYLFDLCKQGLKERYGVDYDAHAAEAREQPDDFGKGEAPDPNDPLFPAFVCAKLDYELAIITGAGFVDYFLIVWDFINWARSRAIPVGPGRGSGAGCMVAYVLKITDIDPLRFGLLFERMLSLERVSPPDFDIDFCMRRRDEVVEYVRDKYGADSVANIITFGTFGAKMIVRDLARVHEVPYAEADRFAKMVPDDLNISLDDALKKSGEMRNEVKSNPIAQRIIDEGKVIEGMVRNTGKHACGIIIGDQPITQLVPVTLQEGDLTTQYPKGPVEDLGLLKMDFLGLKTLTVISDAQEHVRRTTSQPNFDTEKLPLDDAKTYALLNTGQTTGVFQLESGGMQNLCRRLGLSSFEEIIALIALYRPGPMQFIDQYIEGKKDPQTIQVPHPKVKDLVTETYGILVYQEQVMEVARLIAGFTLGNADILRRAMGKKIASLMAEQKEKFVAGAKTTTGLSAAEAGEIFALLEKFAQYGFNKSHSAAYAMLSYRTAYLKANYPVQFMAAVLSCELGNSDKLAHLIGECGAMGLKVAGPDINHSRNMFTPVFEKDEGSILFGMAAIKGVGDGAAQSIIEEREVNGPFKSFQDFASRIDTKAVNRRVIESLIRTGAFDEFGDDRAALLESLDGILKEVAGLQRDREQGQTNMFDMMMGGPEESDDGAVAVQTPIRSTERMSMAEKLQHEKDLLGFYVSGHPMDNYQGLAEGLTTFSGDGYKDLEDRTPFRLCGVITGIAKKLSRRDNRPWAIISLSTRENAYTLNMYADTYEKVTQPYFDAVEAWKQNNADKPESEQEPRPEDPLASGRVLALEGVVNQRNGEAVLNVNAARDIDRLIPEMVSNICWVIEPNGHAEDFFQRLADTARPAMGRTTLQIAFDVAGDFMPIADVASSLAWRVNTSGFQQLRKHPAVRDVYVEAPAPERQDPPWMKFAKKNGS